MNKKTLSLQLMLWIPFVLLLALFLWMLKTNIASKGELAKKNEELRKASAASDHLESLEKQRRQLQQQEDALDREVPAHEKNAFFVIKALSEIAQEEGLQKIVFSVVQEHAVGKAPSMQGAPGMMMDDLMMEEQSSRGGSPEEDSMVRPLRFTMTCLGTYPQLVQFIRKALSLERIVCVNTVTIDREQKILPLQQISLDMATYVLNE